MPRNLAPNAAKAMVVQLVGSTSGYQISGFRIRFSGARKPECCCSHCHVVGVEGRLRGRRLQDGGKQVVALDGVERRQRNQTVAGPGRPKGGKVPMLFHA